MTKMPLISIRLSQQQLMQLLNHQDVVINLVSEQENLPVRSFFQFFNEQTEWLKANGNIRTAETYRASYIKLYSFLGNQDLNMSDITSELAERYQTYLRKQNLSLNTISFYMRVFRSVYRKAVERGLVADCQPFTHVYTGMSKTDKRAISLEDIRYICRFKTEDRQLSFARDMFLFSFYTRGMAFVDMANLRRDDIQDGYLTYKRHKTGQMLRIRWEQEMQDIVDRYPVPQHSPYLLPIILKQNGKERNQYRYKQTEVNKYLKQVAQQADIDCNLTMYVARHSWATIAKRTHVPLEIISRGMGHSNERTTAIYLKAAEESQIDKANRKILSLIQ